MRHGILLVSLLWTLSVPAQQPQPADAATAEDYCEAVIRKWDLLFQWARAAAPDIETGLADLDTYAERGRSLVDTSLFSYEARFLERAYLQAIVLAVQLAVYGEDRVNDMTEQLKEGAHAQCVNGVLDTLTEVPLPPRL